MLRILVAGALALALASPAAGTETVTVPVVDESDSPKIRPNGLRLESGVVFPENASAAPLIGGRLDLGSIGKPWLDFSAGVTHWSADIDRGRLGSATTGEISDTRFAFNATVDLFEIKRVKPYVDAGVALHRVSADIPADASLADALSGTNLGPEAALGLSTELGAFHLTGEARRELVSDVKNWTFQLGVAAYWGGPRKRGADEAAAVPADAYGTTVAPTTGTPAPVDDPATDEVRALRDENRALRTRVESLERQREAGANVAPPKETTPPQPEGNR